METKIEYFFVGQDVQIQIDEKNPEWYDTYGKLLIENIDNFLIDNGFIEDSFEVWRNTYDNKLYSFTDMDINSLKKTGVSRMYYIGLKK